MSDLQPFVHGEESTHSACAERINKEGGNARCCYCSPHTPCTLSNPTTMTKSTTCPTCGDRPCGNCEELQFLQTGRSWQRGDFCGHCPTCHGTGEVAAEQPEPCLGCEQINFDEQGNCRTCAPSTEQPKRRKTVTAKIVNRRRHVPQQTPGDMPNFSSMVFGPDSPPTEQPCEPHGMYGKCPGHPGPYDPPTEARELKERISRIMQGYRRNAALSGGAWEQDMFALITSEANRLAGEREAAARREGVEMCWIALFHDAASVDGVIMLDTGETAIRYNDLLSDPESALTTYTKGDK